jgi:exosome complex component CSL4
MTQLNLTSCKMQVIMSASFRPGDLVKAEAISLGTMREYVLSTNKPTYGVIWARSLEGAPMEPLNWKEMRCPVSGQVEKRKVAKLAPGP